VDRSGARAPRLVALRVDRAAAGPAVERVWADGDAVLLLDPDAPASHRAALLGSLRPDALVDLIEGRGGDQALADPLPTAVGTAVVVATSGSTGAAKGVDLTHDALAASTRASLARLGARPGDRWALLLPTHHVAGLQVWLRAWASGHDPIHLDDTADLVGSGAAFVSLVPTQLARWLEQLAVTGPPAATPPTVLLGGAAAPPGLIDRATAAGIRVVTSYGMSETGGGCVYDGRPLDGVEVGIDGGPPATSGAGGRIGLRGPVLGAGYRGRSAPFTDDEGWFWTSDLGRLEPDGRLHVLGRADDVAISGGENVPLGIVRDTLATHPTVGDVAVVGRPDARWGEVVVAVVVPAPGTAPTLAALRDHVRSTHPAAYAPQRLAVVDALPRDAMGKLPRPRLEALADLAGGE
jgi:o-succinylbenzoate---CoA ligase